jgi:hypothetical protein
MLLRQVALVSESSSISSSEVNKVAAALQKQATRDFGPLWNVSATVDAYAKLEDVPIDYWPILVQDDINEPGAAGIHLDKDGQPFSLVQAGNGWDLTASHECLEMLADPFGNRLRSGKSPKKGQGRVRFLVEVCDPPEAEAFAYTVNGITVSDFITPHFYDPVAAPGVRYSFTGAITKPRQVLQGGYISWLEPRKDEWWQEIFFGNKPEFRNLGRLARNGQSLREMIDGRTVSPELHKRMTAKRPTARAMAARIMDNGHDADGAKARADALHEQIDEIRAAGRETMMAPGARR